MVETLDANLAHFAAIVERDLGVAIARPPRLGRRGRPGRRTGRLRRRPARAGRSTWSSTRSTWRARLDGADLCLTGEGALDDQSAFGKTAVGVGRLARSLGCPTLALAGSIGPAPRPSSTRASTPTSRSAPARSSLDQAIAHAGELLEAGDGAGRAGVPGRTAPAP